MAVRHSSLYPHSHPPQPTFSLAEQVLTCGIHPLSWIFILEGIMTVLAGVLAYFVMVDRPLSLRLYISADLDS